MEDYPFVKARWFYSGRNKKPRLAIVHTAETLEGHDSAENLAKWFSYTDRKVSAHLCGDNNSICRSVHDSDTAFAAPGANADGFQYEMAGRAIQDPTQWNDPYSRAAISLMAKAFAGWCRQHSIAARLVGPPEIRAGQAGICGHWDITNAYRQSTHTDPGQNFPWSSFMNQVRAHLSPTTPSWTVAVFDDPKEGLMKRIDFSTPQLDDQGNGVMDQGAMPVLGSIPKDRVVNILENGSGYRIASFAPAAFLGGTKLYIEGGPPRGSMDISIWVAEG